MASLLKGLRRKNRKHNRNRKNQRGVYSRSLRGERLEDRRMLAVDVMTFDLGATTSTSHSEAGMTAEIVGAASQIVIYDHDGDGDDELLLHEDKTYGPYEFSLDTGQPFTLISIEVEGDVIDLALISSTGATETLTSVGVHTLPSSDWTNITSFQVSHPTKFTFIDNITLEAGTVAADDSAETDEDIAVTVDVLANDLSEVGGTLAIDSVTAPNFGTATIDDNSTPGISDDDKIIYTPGADDYGTAIFEYTISDGLGDTSTATVTVEVIPVNDPPVVDLNGDDEEGIDFETLFAGSPTEITDIDATLFDSDGGIAVTPNAIFVVNASGEIIKVDSDTGDQTSIGNNGKLINNPGHLVVDESTGLIYVVDIQDKKTLTPEIVQVDPLTGVETSIGFFGRKGYFGQGIAIDASGDLIVNWQRGLTVSGVSSVERNSGAETIIGTNSLPHGIGGLAVEADGSILHTDTNSLYRVDPTTGVFSTLSTGPFVRVFDDVDVDSSGNIYVMGRKTNAIAQVDPVSGSQTLLTSTGTNIALAVDSAGDPVFIQRPKKVAGVEIIHVAASDGTQTEVTSGGLLFSSTGIDLTGGILAGDFISSLTVTITNQLDGASELLSADTTGTDITANYDAGTGVLSLTGVDAAASYQAVLRTITYDNTSATPNTSARVLEVVASDGLDDSEIAVATIVLNRPPEISNQSFDLDENNTSAGNVVASDPDVGDILTYAITGGADAALFDIDANTGALSFITAPDFETPLDAGTDNIYDVQVTVSDDDNASASADMSVNVLNLASISGVVFVDVNGNGAYDANEPGIDGVTIELRDENGDDVLDAHGAAITAITSDGGFYLFEDLDPGDYQLHQLQPSGVTDGEEILGSLAGDFVVSNDVMQLSLVREDAYDYAFAELGQQVAAGDTATIGFWQNKHGQALIAEGGTGVANWLTTNFGNVFGDSLLGASGEDVADFYRAELFKQKGKKSAAGPAKVDAQFMAVALATYFTSSNLAGSVASGFGFNVTDTGIGTKIVNVGSAGAAFNVSDGTDLTIMQLLLATDSLTDQPNDVDGFAFIYDQDGNGEIDSAEELLRSLANEIYTDINEGGDI